MLATARAALEEGRSVPRRERTVGRIATAIAYGALMGARGNSGVILSQILRGMARGLEGRERGNATDLAQAFLHATDAAYEAVASPVEGTILTVMRHAAEAAHATGSGRDEEAPSDVGDVLQASVQAAAASVARTPEMLAVLRDAGVVDAGGQGLLRLLEGALGYNRGTGPRTAPQEEERVPLPGVAATPAPPAQPDAALLGEREYGYETVYLLAARNAPLDLPAIRSRLEQLGDSVLVAGDEQLAKVHIHNDRPDAVIAYGFEVGDVRRIAVQDLDGQVHEAIEELVVPAPTERPPVSPTVEPAPAPRGPSIVAVAAGEGLERALRSLGVERIVRGGQSSNPSTGELVEAIRAVPSIEVVVLPNNPNVLLAARQAADLCPEKHVLVVPTRNVAEGIGAVLACDSTGDAAANLDRMTQAAHAIQTLQVTDAVRDAEVAGIPIRQGQTMVLSPDEGLYAKGDDPVTTVLDGFEHLVHEFELVTIYAGADATDEEARRICEAIRERHDGVEVELVRGDQPHYRYLVAAE
jgi:DAK2 domain fusion protein YloV